jgi:WXG100 family type VII secretion target
MTGGRYETDIQTMVDAGQKVANVNSQVQSRLQQYKRQIESVRGLWEGPAAVSFQQLMIDWDKNASQLNQALKTIGERLDKNRTRYQESEDSNKRGMSSIQSRLG